MYEVYNRLGHNDVMSIKKKVINRTENTKCYTEGESERCLGGTKQTEKCVCIFNTWMQ